MTVDVLGTEYRVEIRKHDEDPLFEKDECDGYTVADDHLIVVQDMSTTKEYDGCPNEAIVNRQKIVLRHELVHAFMYESGLSWDAFAYDGAWPHNEEMIDWIARQGPKIYKAWKAVGAI